MSAMNGQPLPLLNGYPVRLIVPGWYATYWVKMLNDIEVIGKVDDNFWMKTAYRIPDNACGCTEPGKAAGRTIPIHRLTVRSFLTSPADGARVTADRPLEVRGIAFDGGFGIHAVVVRRNASDGREGGLAAGPEAQALGLGLRHGELRCAFRIEHGLHAGGFEEVHRDERLRDRASDGEQAVVA